MKKYTNLYFNSYASLQMYIIAYLIRPMVFMQKFAQKNKMCRTVYKGLIQIFLSGHTPLAPGVLICIGYIYAYTHAGGLV